MNPDAVVCRNCAWNKCVLKANDIYENHADLGSTVISIMNGIGDAVISMRVVEYLNEKLKTKNPVVTSQILESTVLSGYTGEVYDIESRGAEILEKFKNKSTIWISLNSYKPLSNAEAKLLECVNPEKIVILSDVLEKACDNCKSKTPMSIWHGRCAGIRARDLRNWNKKIATNRKIAEYKMRFATVHMDSHRDKEWAEDRWGDVIRYLEKRGFGVLVVGQKIIGDKKWKKCSSNDWRVHKDFVINSDIFVGIDSCFSHVADVYGVEGVILFGPTQSDIWGPIGHTLSTIQAEKGDMSGISSAQVIEAINARINNQLGTGKK